MEHISAMMDNELDDTQMAGQVARLREHPELREGWDTFHLIGDVIRGERLLNTMICPAVSEKLAFEPTVLSPWRTSPKRMRTFAFSAAASMAAIALVGWLAFFDNPLSPSQQVAKAPAKPPSSVSSVSSPQLSSVPSDGTMNEYLIAHQEYSPSTAIQGLAPYIRTVSSARPAPRQ